MELSSLTCLVMLKTLDVSNNSIYGMVILLQYISMYRYAIVCVLVRDCIVTAEVITWPRSLYSTALGQQNS